MATHYRIAELKLPLDYDQAALEQAVLAHLGCPAEDLLELHIVRRSVDARKKPSVFFVFLLEVRLAQPLAAPVAGVSAVEPEPPRGPLTLMERRLPDHLPVVVVGAGPAGYFAALTLAEAGVRTILLERGKPVETRMRDIGQLRSHGKLDCESNICFGEGGAGAYTDGKLYTRIKHPYVGWVMRRLVDFEAPADILFEAHPHLGTDKLVRLVKRMREHLIAKGVEVRFSSRLEDVQLVDGRVTGLRLADGELLNCDHVLLGIGHSARDTLAQLWRSGVHMESKPFAVGVRVEHPQELIDRNQYGDPEHKRVLGAAAYALTHQIHEGARERGIYSFCMCPGGFIVPSPTELSHMAINGMSNANRSTAFANSGIVVQVETADLLRAGFEETPLMGIAFQRALEAACFAATRQAYAAPGMRIADFVAGRPSGTLAPTNFRPAIEACDLREILPPWVSAPLKAGLISFDRKLRGFTSAEANMLAVESRTSSPIRITRDAQMESVNTRGLYPIGEGAGYAGGIVSAAVDGVKAAELVVERLLAGA